MKYRVKYEYGIYYPQVREYFFWWHSTCEPEMGCHTLEDALKDIEEHKKAFSKRKDNIVWRN